VGLAVKKDRMVLAQVREPRVRHAFGEDVPVEQVDVLESHGALHVPTADLNSGSLETPQQMR